MTSDLKQRAVSAAIEKVRQMGFRGMEFRAGYQPREDGEDFIVTVTWPSGKKMSVQVLRSELQDGVSPEGWWPADAPPSELFSDGVGGLTSQGTGL